MKILIIDIYKDTNYRISKDTSGGYGTGNDFGDSFTAKFLKKELKKIHDWPPLFLAYSKYYFRISWLYKYFKSFLFST
jgi:hypothetical protein|tara:strand:- start:144 stop:377 length:234 start_codon:yes stop_codon:yes gene_type:complete